MDEFRKPFEYQEEKRGLLTLFIIMITVIDGSVSASLTLQVYGILKAVPAAGISFIAAGAIFLKYILYTAIYCYRLKEGAAKAAKVYLVVRALYTALRIMAVYMHSIGGKTLIGNGPRQFRSTEELTTMVLIYPMIYTIAFSAIWFVYFSRSRRFRKDALGAKEA